MIKRIFALLFFICSATSIRTLAQSIENAEYIDEVILTSDEKVIFITRLSALKLFEINGHRYDYDTIFTGKPRRIHWVDNAKSPFPLGFLYDLDEDNAYIKPIGYNKDFIEKHAALIFK